MRPYIILFICLCSQMLSGCTECYGDTCGYQAAQPAVWSEDDDSLALMITDLGESRSTSDNQYYLYTLDVDGSNFQEVGQFSTSKILRHYNVKNQYAIVQEGGYSSGYKSFYQVDITQQSSMLLVNRDNQPCLDYEVIPSLSGDYIAIVTFEGVEIDSSRALKSARSISSTAVASTSIYSSRVCTDFELTVDIIDAVAGGIIGRASSLNSYTSFGIYYDGNVIDLNLESAWTSSGFIISNFDTVNLSSRYAHIAIDGSVSEYEVAFDCGQHETSSGLYSSGGREAMVIGFVGSEQAMVTLYENVDEGSVLCTPI